MTMRPSRLAQIATSYQHRAALAHKWARFYAEHGDLRFAVEWQHIGAHESRLAVHTLFMLLEHR